MRSKQGHKLKIYVAGKMEWHNEEDSIWRNSLEIPLEFELNDKGVRVQVNPQVEFLLPSNRYFDHGGDIVKGIVEADIRLVEEADGIVAVFTDNSQVGTMVELLHALSMGKPCLAIFVRPMVNLECGVINEELLMRVESDHYWFLINYLVKYPIVSCVAIADKKAALSVTLEWLKRLLRWKYKGEVM